MSDMRLVVNGAAGPHGPDGGPHDSTRRRGLKVVGALERAGAPTLGQDAGTLAGLSEPLGVPVTDDPLPLHARRRRRLDFAAPEATADMAALAAQARIAHVIGTTGLTEDLLAKIAAAARHAPIVRSGNMSLGVNLLAGAGAAGGGCARATNSTSRSSRCITA